MGEDERDRLVRLEERVKALAARIEESERAWRAAVDKACDKFSNYVSRVEFIPVKTLVYGFVGLVLVSFVGAMIALVVDK